MKAKSLIVTLLLALLVSLVPMSAFAAAPQELTVFVRNTTGGVVDLKLTDADDGIHWLTLEPGVFETTLMEGVYEYYAVTICGTQSGVWNLNVSKQLDIHCTSGMLDMTLTKRCDDNRWGIIYHPSGNTNITSTGFQSITLRVPLFFYVAGDSTNLMDVVTLLNGDTIVQGETICWSDWLRTANGNPYYVGDGIWLNLPF